MLFIQKCPVRGLKSFRHEIILPYFFRGIVGQKIAKNATFLGGFFEGLDVKISVFFARPFFCPSERLLSLGVKLLYFAFLSLEGSYFAVFEA